MENRYFQKEFETMPVDEIKNIDRQKRRVVEIRVFYDDQTWESFSPAKK